MKKITLLFVCIGLLSINKSFAQPSGWNNFHAYTVTENSGATVLNYQLKLTVDTQTPITAGDMNANGDDIRFGNDCSGSILFNYWIESGINTTTTIIWVKIDTLYASSTRTIYMYYGNPSAPAISAISGTFTGPNSSTDSLSGGTAQNVHNCQRGFRFSPNEDILVTHFGRNEPNGTQRYITLFGFYSHAILSQIQVSGPAAQYSYGMLPSPMWLYKDTMLILEMYTNGTDQEYWYNGTTQHGQQITLYDVRYRNACTQNDFPSLALTFSEYGYPDLLYWRKKKITPAPTYADGTALAVNPASNVSECGGVAVSIGSVATGGSGQYSYLWSPTSNLSSSTIAQPLASPTTTTTYTVQVTDVACGTMVTASVTVTPHSLPTVIAQTSADSICSGSTVTLTGSGANSYTWDNGASDGVATSPAGTTLYTVTGTDANGCINTNAITVNVEIPVVTANSSANTVCAGDMVTLTGSGAVSYVWDNSATDGVAIAVPATVTFMVTGTTALGCTSTATTTVTANSLPTITAYTTDSAVCAGEYVTLTVSGTSVSYSWNNSVSTAVPFAPASTLTYIVTGTDINNCVNTSSITVTVNPLPTVTGTASFPSICIGDTETLTGGGANTYSWDNSVLDGVGFLASPTVTSFIVTGTDANNCVNTATVSITVNSLPAVTANASDDTICGGDTLTLAGGGASSYTWDNSVTDNSPFVPALSTNYTVTGTDGNGCVNTNSVFVHINPLPSVSIDLSSVDSLCTYYPIANLIGELPAGGIYSGAGVSGNTIDPSIPAVGTTTVTYTYTDINGCVNSASGSIYIDVCTGIANANPALSEITVYPNPTTGLVYITADKTTQVILYNELNEVVLSQEVVSGKNTINISSLAKGIYLLKADKQSMKIVKE